MHKAFSKASGSGVGSFSKLILLLSILTITLQENQDLARKGNVPDVKVGKELIPLNQERLGINLPSRWFNGCMDQVEKREETEDKMLQNLDSGLESASRTLASEALQSQEEFEIRSGTNYETPNENYGSGRFVPGGHAEVSVLPVKDGLLLCYELIQPLTLEKVFPLQLALNNMKRAYSKYEDGIYFGKPEDLLWKYKLQRDECSLRDMAIHNYPLASWPKTMEAKLLENVSNLRSIASILPSNNQSLLRDHPIAFLDSSHSDQDYEYSYILKRNFARGAFGELWLAVRRECNATNSKMEDSHAINYDEIFVLKKIMSSADDAKHLSGLREKYFGEVFLNASKSSDLSSQGTCINDCGVKRELQNGLSNIVRYISSYETKEKGLWLIFKMEGQSLSKLLYDAEEIPGFHSKTGKYKVLTSSAWWKWLRTTKAGQQEMQSLLRQLLLAVKACHDRNITHRDIKPENLVVGSLGKYSVFNFSKDNMPANLTLRLIDFGSAIDVFTMKNLYGSDGPTQKEQTMEYAPPEALFFKHWLHLHPDQTTSYDMWSIGVVMLELVLGTPHVFQISSRVRAFLNQQYKELDDDSKQTLYLLRAFIEMCILIPYASPQHHDHLPLQPEVHPVSWDCSESAVMQQIKQRDPLNLGMPNVWAVRLLRQLLQWYPEDRISVDDALNHPYFKQNFEDAENKRAHFGQNI